MTRYLIVVALLLAGPASAKDAVTAVTLPPLSAAHAAAIRDCNAAARRYIQRTYGVREIMVYRSCMAKTGYHE